MKISELKEQFAQYLDISGDAEMLKQNPNLVTDAHDRVWDKIENDFEGSELPDLSVVATKYFAAYVNDKGKKTFFPPNFFPL